MNERVAFEAWCDDYWDTSAYLHKSRTCGEWAAWRAARVDRLVLLAQVDSLRTALERLLDAQTKETKLQARTLLLTLKRVEP
jgi:ABC-type oligopeptide transport system substrate-binding subunit